MLILKLTHFVRITVVTTFITFIKCNQNVFMLEVSVFVRDFSSVTPGSISCFAVKSTKQ